MPISSDWTLEMVHALPEDGTRYELLDGELLVSPAPSFLHQRLVLALGRALADYCDQVGALETFVAPVAITFSERRELQPDICVLPKPPGKEVQRFEDVGHLVLAVEVLSPTTALVDRNRKRRAYMQESVGECWLVDPESRVIERWQSNAEEPEIVVATLDWRPLASHPALRIDLFALFDRVCG